MMRCVVKLIFVMLCGLTHPFAKADPNLQDVRSFGGVTVIADHADQHVFYYLKSEKRLLTRDKAPDFSYHVNRYIGKKQTGDQDAFWVRGVIKFAATSDFLNTDLATLSNTISQQQGREIELKAAPISNEYNRLVYALIDADEAEEFNGEITAANQLQNTSTDNTEIQRRYGSTRQRFTIGVSDHDANLFWDNFARDNLSLSLAYGWTIPGLIKDPNDEWVSSVYQVNNSMPIQVSSQQYPQLFSKNELWQRLSYAHTTLKVMCYDFINLAQHKLYYVAVDVRFETFNGRYYQEQIRFLADSDRYEVDLPFELANDIKQGYDYRISRLTEDGERDTSEWLHSNAAWIDVSLSSEQLQDYQIKGESL